MSETDIADQLRELANEIEVEEQRNRVPKELQEAAPPGTTVYDTDAEGWDTVTEYVVSVDPEELSVESRATRAISELEGYEIAYVAWGRQTDIPEAPVELCISEVEE